MFLGSEVVGDGTSNLIGRMRCSIEVNLDWTAKVSSFLMGYFWKITMLHKSLFLG